MENNNSSKQAWDNGILNEAPPIGYSIEAETIPSHRLVIEVDDLVGDEPTALPQDSVTIGPAESFMCSLLMLTIIGVG